MTWPTPKGGHFNQNLQLFLSTLRGGHSLKQNMLDIYFKSTLLFHHAVFRNSSCLLITSLRHFQNNLQPSQSKQFKAELCKFHVSKSKSWTYFRFTILQFLITREQYTISDTNHQLSTSHKIPFLLHFSSFPLVWPGKWVGDGGARV